MWEVTVRDSRDEHSCDPEKWTQYSCVSRCQEDAVSGTSLFKHLHTPRGCEMSGPLPTDFPPGFLGNVCVLWGEQILHDLSPSPFPFLSPSCLHPLKKAGTQRTLMSPSLLMASSAGSHCSTLQTFQVPFASVMLSITAPKTGTEHLSVPSPAGVMVDS